jgi:hypothetical protein
MLQWRFMVLGGWRRALIAVQLTLMSAVPVGERLIPSAIHLAPGLGVAPAMAAVSASPRRTALIGALAVAALTIAKIDRSALTTEDFIVQTLSLVLLTALLVVFCYLRDRREASLPGSAWLRRLSSALSCALFPPGPGRCRSYPPTMPPMPTRTSAATFTPWPAP